LGASAEVARPMTAPLTAPLTAHNILLSRIVTKRNLQAGLAYARSRRRLR